VRALVTGAAGLVGAGIVRALLDSGESVRALVRTESGTAALGDLPLEIVTADVRSADGLAPAMAGCDVVFHAAAHFAYSGLTASELEETTLSGTGHVLRAAREAGVRRVVVTSSSVVLGYSLNREIRDESSGLAAEEGEAPYVVAKLRQDRLALALGEDLRLDVVLVCPTMTLGPSGARLGPSNGIVVAYLADPFRTTFPGGCNLVSSLDVGHAHRLAAKLGTPGERYLAGSENLEWEAIHRMIAELCGVPGPRLRAGHAACYLGASAEEARASFRGRAPLTTREQARMVGRFYWYSHSRLARLGYAPRSARAALAAAVSWLAASPHVSRELRAGLRLSPEVWAARRAESAENAGRRRSA
jgi:dihydroflavonol-4-reductase